MQCCLESLGQHCKRILPVHLLDNIAQGFCPCNVVPKYWDKTEQVFFPVLCSLESIRQHCTSILLVQCFPKSIETKLNRFFSCAILSGASWTTLHKDFTYFPNVVPQVLRQHRTWFFPVECYLNPLGHHCTRILLAQWVVPRVLRQHWKGFFLCNVVWSLLDKTAQGFYLYFTCTFQIRLRQHSTRKLLVQC